MSFEKKALLNLSQKDLILFLEKHSFPRFRAKQIHEWIYQKKSIDFQEMKNLPSPLKDLLQNHFVITSLQQHQNFHSQNNKNTSKMILKTKDGYFIEMVIIPNSKGHYTLCVSSQIGCDMACDFCATGKMGLTRSLTQEEILGQFLFAAHRYNISNIVFMGMGEPFLNSALFPSLDRLIAPEYFQFKDRSITVSTSGIVEGIKHMIHYKQIKLALSYHSSIPEKREILFPVLNLRHSFEELIEAILFYREKTQKRITLEYTLIKGINDTFEEAQGLLDLNQKLYFFLNIIPYNVHELSPYKTPSRQDIDRFVGYLKGKIPTNIRSSRGGDINAACGQLAYREKNEEFNLDDNFG